MTKVMISCGEPSGDMYAGSLVSELRKLEPDVSVFGLGGKYLESSCARLIGDYRGLAVTGLSEALSVIPRSLTMYRRLVSAARTERPDVFVAIDFPDFNFRLARSMNRLGVPVVYYIGPQVWAWRKDRLRTLKRLVTRALVIFPFEEDIYHSVGIPVEFVGHPLIDLARVGDASTQFMKSVGLDPNFPTVALLPGSRPNELRTILPRLISSASLIANRIPGVQFFVARAPNLDPILFNCLNKFQSQHSPDPILVEARTDEILSASDIALTASGTATVQAAIHECPMIIVYRLSPLTYYIAKHFVHVESIGMVNLIAGKKIVPEFVQRAFTPEAVADEAVSFLTDEERLQHTRQMLRAVRSKLGAPGASVRAAHSILSVARSAPTTG